MRRQNGRRERFALFLRSINLVKRFPQCMCGGRGLLTHRAKGSTVVSYSHVRKTHWNCRVRENSGGGAGQEIAQVLLGSALCTAHDGQWSRNAVGFSCRFVGIPMRGSSTGRRRACWWVCRRHREIRVASGLDYLLFLCRCMSCFLIVNRFFFWPLFRAVPLRA